MIFEKGSGQALYFTMRSDGIPTVPSNLAVLISGDGGAFGASTNSPTSVGNGLCSLTITDAEANMSFLTIKATADNCDTDLFDFWFEDSWTSTRAALIDRLTMTLTALQSALQGGDNDTLETLSDQVDDVTLIGSGANACTITIKDASGNLIADCNVWISTDVGGSVIVAGTLRTDSNGHVLFMLDAGATYYCWRKKDGTNFTGDNPEEFVAVAD